MTLFFNVTYEIVTPESAEQGDAEDRGFVTEDASLREALGYVAATRTSRCGGVEIAEASDSDLRAARWVTIYNGMEFETGAYESRSLHFPEQLTSSTRRRIARLMGVRNA